MLALIIAVLQRLVMIGVALRCLLLWSFEDLFFLLLHRHTILLLLLNVRYLLDGSRG